MKQLAWKLVLPLTLLSFVVFRKWWYVFPDDAPDSMMAGFPFPYVCDGWFTSMSNQFFVVELTIDLLIYFTFWFLLILTINRFFVKIIIPKYLIVASLIVSTLILFSFVLIGSMRENVFDVYRDFDMEIKETGYNFIWQNTERPNPEMYITKPNKK
ncbi:hypothetical protein FNO01nite_33990 [Flavobacterium noncentrifugens]|uniref:Uncharacterized protein n=1 Tax=Flavobacterium noncentrifugens TaxID=1128970 RepID=A0A1G9DCN6_9FLAO|nr:hypothetical protein [Flavobacterium noncentrifugens]GEP52727.1 hypothetical protein FNO01nite_33990 [Flavobacterium noncentrifugens]SDK61613.1 hypothetical protein SAMN04487935_3780 [Flavobacterium noncentrifugens]